MTFPNPHKTEKLNVESVEKIRNIAQYESNSPDSLNLAPNRRDQISDHKVINNSTIVQIRTEK